MGVRMPWIIVFEELNAYCFSYFGLICLKSHVTLAVVK